MENEDITITVRGNCGLLHDSVEAWQKCQACKSPPPPMTWRDWYFVDLNATDDGSAP